MTTMSTKIPPDMKKRVEKFPYVNWSEVMRTAILSRIIEEEKKNIQRDQHKIAVAVQMMNQLRRPASGNSTEELRQWREQRHS